MRFLRVVSLALVVAAVTASCDNSGSSSSSSTTAPTGNPITDVFTGTVAVGVNNLDSHTFTVVQGNGTISVTLTAAGPPPTISMGLIIGTPSGSSCNVLSGAATNTPAGITPQLTGTIGAGTYCVAVVDIGNANAPIVYSVTVVHF
jgi:hypothetical protein